MNDFRNFVASCNEMCAGTLFKMFSFIFLLIELQDVAEYSFLFSSDVSLC